jgi:hypothetical protein
LFRLALEKKKTKKHNKSPRWSASRPSFLFDPEPKKARKTAAAARHNVARLGAKTREHCLQYVTAAFDRFVETINSNSSSKSRHG